MRRGPGVWVVWWWAGGVARPEGVAGEAGAGGGGALGGVEWRDVGAGEFRVGAGECLWCGPERVVADGGVAGGQPGWGAVGSGWIAECGAVARVEWFVVGSGSAGGGPAGRSYRWVVGSDQRRWDAGERVRCQPERAAADRGVAGRQLRGGAVGPGGLAECGAGAGLEWFAVRSGSAGGGPLGGVERWAVGSGEYRSGAGRCVWG